jgi:hypothetical protein
MIWSLDYMRMFFENNLQNFVCLEPKRPPR